MFASEPADNGAGEGQETLLLDNRSVGCAVGLIKAAQLMNSAPPGSVVEVWSRDRFAPLEIPLRASNEGHTVVGQEKVGRWPRRYWRFLIRCAGPAEE